MRNVAISSVGADGKWGARRARFGPCTEGIHPVMAQPFRPLEDKHCFIYCGDDKCNCLRGRGHRVKYDPATTMLRVLASRKPGFQIALAVNQASLAQGGLLGTTPNFLAGLPPGVRVRVEMRRSPDGITTYWPLDTALELQADLLEPFGPLVQTVTAWSRWQSMDSAPRDGTHILIWNGVEAVECFRGDGQRYPEDWITADCRQTLAHPEVWRHA